MRGEDKKKEVPPRGANAAALERLLEVYEKGVLEQANRLCKEIADGKHGGADIQRLNKELVQEIQKRTKQLVDAQEELVRREKLAVLGQFSEIIRHELRNPLGVINGAVYFLKTITDPADARANEYLDIIKTEVDNSERTISDLLDFSEAKTPLADSVTVNELINQSIAKCAVPAGVRLHVEIPEALPKINVDLFQMVGVFQNLISNSIDAMPDGGSLKINAAEDREGGAVKISVTDTGEGIPPHHMPRLFQPLFTTKPRGIGLGLALSKTTTEANKGKVKVDSQKGKGTTFTVILPAKEG